MAPGAIAALFRRRWIRKNAKNPSPIITPAATPTPIPAFDPLDKPDDSDDAGDCSDDCVAVESELVVADVDVRDSLVDVSLVGVGVGVDEDA